MAVGEQTNGSSGAWTATPCDCDYADTRVGKSSESGVSVRLPFTRRQIFLWRCVFNCFLVVWTLCPGVSVVGNKSELKNGVDVAVGTPGRLMDLINQGAMNLSSVQTMQNFVVC